MSSQIKLRRGTASQWTTTNPVLASAEIGVETDTNKFKLGDGVSDWTELKYFSSTEDFAPIDSPSFSGSVSIDGNLEIGGSLNVAGSVTYINSANLTLEDSLIYLADGNISDLVDIGFVGSYNDGTYQHTGLARDASDDTWKLFKAVVPEPTETIDFTSAVYDDLKIGNLYTANVYASGEVKSYLSMSEKTSTSNTLIISDDGKLVKVNNSSSNTIEVPLSASVAFPVGTEITIMQTGTGQTTITAAAGVTVNSSNGLKLRAQWSSATLIKIDTNIWVVVGDMST